MNVMEISFVLGGYGKHLWTRELAKKIRDDFMKQTNGLAEGEAISIDATGVEVFDFSFANEFFGKTALSMPMEHPGSTVVVEHLTKYARENLEKALESIQATMVERHGAELRLIGKVHPADRETFAAISKARKRVTAAILKDQLGVNLTTMNERLSKLVAGGLICRRTGLSSAGREQYEYWVPA